MTILDCTDLSHSPVKGGGGGGLTVGAGPLGTVDSEEVVGAPQESVPVTKFHPPSDLGSIDTSSGRLGGK